jgi:hypothetical protein
MFPIQIHLKPIVDLLDTLTPPLWIVAIRRTNSLPQILLLILTNENESDKTEESDESSGN